MASLTPAPTQPSHNPSSSSSSKLSSTHGSPSQIPALQNTALNAPPTLLSPWLRLWCCSRRLRQQTPVQFGAFTVLLIFTFVLAAGLCINLRQNSYENDYWDGIFPALKNADGPYMLVEILDINLPGRAFKLRWTIDPFGSQRTESRAPMWNRDGSLYSNVSVDIYRDRDAITTSFTTETRVFSYHAAHSIDWVWTPSFETDLTFMVVPSLVAKTWGSEIYPFDDYSAGIILAAAEVDGSTPHEIIGVKLLGGFFGWETHLKAMQRTNSNGAPIVAVTLFTRRTPVVKVFACCLIVMTWIVTLAIQWIVTREVFGRVHPGVGDTLPLPLTALFALPAIRQFLPGNPPVGGTLDSFGVIPQILVLGSCTCASLVARTHFGCRPLKFWPTS